MQSRDSLLPVLVVAVPIIAVLLAVFVLMQPPAPAPAPASPQDAAASGGPTAAPAPQSSTAPAVATNAKQAVTAAIQPSTANGQQPDPAAPSPPPSGLAAPELVGGGAWINSDPLTLADLKGRVVLIDFWTYGCYNCQNTLPYVRQWWDKYKDQGLVIIGVHTPEFESEQVLANVQAAVQREGIGWPVVQDNDRRIWRAYNNRYWPRFYLVDHRGQIIYDHIGEGAYDETERRIVAALTAARSE